MIKLNNKGMTSVELLVCFIIISAIVVSLFNIVMDLRNKEQIEAIKNEAVSYSNVLQSVVQEYLIMDHLEGVQMTTGSNSTITLNFTLANAKTASLTISPSTNEVIVTDSPNTTNEDRTSYPVPDIADMSLSYDSTATVQNNYLIILIYLEHPNFEDGRYLIEMTAPINYPNS